MFRSAYEVVTRMSEDPERDDFAEQDRRAGEDLAAHATGMICPRCGHVIEAHQTARLRGAGQGQWVHDMCPAGDDSLRDRTRAEQP